jgi:predicted TIM-barrel fold metal-dependent hydrolase
MTRAAFDVDALAAIDMHVHVEQDGHGCFSLDQELLDASAKYFKATADRTPTVERLAEHYRALSMAAVIFTVDATTGLGHPALSSFAIADAAAEHADVLIPFGSVDPHDTAVAVERVRGLVDDHGVRGFKFHPTLQAFARTTSGSIRSTRRSRGPGCRSCSTPARRRRWGPRPRCGR